jgi:hypothetical protein
MRRAARSFHVSLATAYAAALVLVVGCSDDSAAGSSTSTDATTTEVTTGSSSTGDAGLLPACVGLSSPFLDGVCLEAMRVACNALGSEMECVASEPWVFDDGAYVIGCGWATYAVVESVSACTIGESGRRCEGYIQQLGGGFGDPCSGDPDTSGAWTGLIEAQELVFLPGGPIGPWSEVGNTSDPVSTCAPNVTPPPDALCDCASAACDALEGG